LEQTHAVDDGLAIDDCRDCFCRNETFWRVLPLAARVTLNNCEVGMAQNLQFFCAVFADLCICHLCANKNTVKPQKNTDDTIKLKMFGTVLL